MARARRARLGRPAAGGGRGADRGVPGRHADGARCGRRGRLRARRRSSSRWSSSATAPTCSRSFPATAAPTSPRSRPPSLPPRSGSRARTRSSHATGFEPGAVAPFPQRAVTRTLMDKVVLPPSGGLDRRRLAGPHGGARLRSSLHRLSRARPVDLGTARVDCKAHTAVRTKESGGAGDREDLDERRARRLGRREGSRRRPRPALRLRASSRAFAATTRRRARRSSAWATTCSACTTRRASSTCRSRSRSTS